MTISPPPAAAIVVRIEFDPLKIKIGDPESPVVLTSLTNLIASPLDLVETTEIGDVIARMSMPKL
jgi:hypothetical protein